MEPGEILRVAIELEPPPQQQQLQNMSPQIQHGRGRILHHSSSSNGGEQGGSMVTTRVRTWSSWGRAGEMQQDIPPEDWMKAIPVVSEYFRDASSHKAFLERTEIHRRRSSASEQFSENDFQVIAMKLVSKAKQEPERIREFTRMYDAKIWVDVLRCMAKHTELLPYHTKQAVFEIYECNEASRSSNDEQGQPGMLPEIRNVLTKLPETNYRALGSICGALCLACQNSKEIKAVAEWSSSWVLSKSPDQAGPGCRRPSLSFRFVQLAAGVMEVLIYNSKFLFGTGRTTQELEGPHPEENSSKSSSFKFQRKSTDTKVDATIAKTRQAAKKWLGTLKKKGQESIRRLRSNSPSTAEPRQTARPPLHQKSTKSIPLHMMDSVDRFLCSEKMRNVKPKTVSELVAEFGRRPPPPPPLKYRAHLGSPRQINTFGSSGSSQGASTTRSKPATTATQRPAQRRRSLSTPDSIGTTPLATFTKTPGHGQSSNVLAPPPVTPPVLLRAHSDPRNSTPFSRGFHRDTLENALARRLRSGSSAKDVLAATMLERRDSDLAPPPPLRRSLSLTERLAPT